MSGNHTSQQSTHWSLIPDIGEDVFVHHQIWSESKAHPPSHLAGTGTSFPGMKQPKCEVEGMTLTPREYQHAHKGIWRTVPSYLCWIFTIILAEGHVTEKCKIYPTIQNIYNTTKQWRSIQALDTYVIGWATLVLSPNTFVLNNLYRVHQSIWCSETELSSAQLCSSVYMTNQKHRDMATFSMETNSSIRCTILKNSA